MSPTAQRSASEARDAWDRAIDVWEDFQEAGRDFARDEVHGPALRKAIGPVRGKRVLDLGCGQGRFTRSLARAGARVSAVDWSTAMIGAARKHEADEPLGIDYRMGDARTVGRLWKTGSFDVVVGCMSFMDMPELPRVLRAANAVLRPGGRLVFSIAHPFNTAEVDEGPRPGPRLRGLRVDRYFDERMGVTRWRMERLKRPFDTPYWHRPLEQWFRLLQQSGFIIERLSEPRASPSQARAQPKLRATRRFPFFLVFACRKRVRAAR
jgi:SAM-dependent methyltransferase